MKIGIIKAEYVGWGLDKSFGIMWGYGYVRIMLIWVHIVFHGGVA